MNNKLIKQCLWAYMIIMFFVSAYIYGIVLKANGDNVEHLHTSWLVWMGYVPYKDFFQHHNPLTWYLSAPLVAYMIDDFNVFSVFNIIGVATLYVIAYWQYKIFLLDAKDKTMALLLAATLISAYSLLWSTDYRPDTFMFAFYYMGLYELFYYVKNQALSAKPLILSFLFLFISFMFTQKVLMHLVIPGLATIYWLFSGKIKFTHLLEASILPLLLLMAFLGYLYENDTLEVYWRANYPFNTYIPKIFMKQRVLFPPHEYVDFYIFIPLGTVAATYFLYKGNTIERIFSLMFWLETYKSFYYFSAFLHYVIFWLMLAIMLTAMYLSNFNKERQFFAVIGIALIFGVFRYISGNYEYRWTTVNDIWFAVLLGSLTIMIISSKFSSKIGNVIIAGIYLLYIGWYSYHITYKREIKTHELVNGHEVAFKVLTPCDYALNGYYATYNLKARDLGYYSILLGQIDILGEKAGIRKRDNLNELIRERKPKLISVGIFWDTYWEQRGKKIPAHKIDPYLVETYYDYSGVGDIHILKPQYQHHNCVYNGKEWKYMD